MIIRHKSKLFFPTSSFTTGFFSWRVWKLSRVEDQGEWNQNQSFLKNESQSDHMPLLLPVGLNVYPLALWHIYMMWDLVAHIQSKAQWSIYAIHCPVEPNGIYIIYTVYHLPLSTYYNLSVYFYSIYERESVCISPYIFLCTCLRAAQSRLATSLLGPTVHGEKRWVH